MATATIDIRFYQALLEIIRGSEGVYIGNTLDILPKRKDIRIADIILIRSDICSNADILELAKTSLQTLNSKNKGEYNEY